MAQPTHEQDKPNKNYAKERSTIIKSSSLVKHRTRWVEPTQNLPDKFSSSVFIAVLLRFNAVHNESEHCQLSEHKAAILAIPHV